MTDAEGPARPKIMVSDEQLHSNIPYSATESDTLKERGIKLRTEMPRQETPQEDRPGRG